MYSINTEYFEAGTSEVNLNYKSQERDKVGEWITEPIFISLSKAPTNMMCFSSKDWLKLIRPKLKEAHDYYYRKKTKNKERIIPDKPGS